MKTISDADWEIIKSAAQEAIDTTLERSKHKKWSDALTRAELSQPGGMHAANANLGSLVCGAVGVGVWRK